MEKLDKKCSLATYERYIEEYSYFGWEVANLNKDEEYTYIQFQRDPNLKNYNRLKQLEQEWFSFDYPPLWPLILLTILSFACLTGLLVTWMVTPKEDFNLSLYLLSMGLPGLIFSILSFLYLWYRVKKMKKVLDEGPILRAKIKKEALELLNDGNKND